LNNTLPIKGEKYGGNNQEINDSLSSKLLVNAQDDRKSVLKNKLKSMQPQNAAIGESENENITWSNESTVTEANLITSAEQLLNNSQNENSQDQLASEDAEKTIYESFYELLDN
jgi:hypothetical protein